MTKQFVSDPLDKGTHGKVFDLLNREIERQKNTINLIASECIQSKAIRDIMGQPLHKYAEGEPFDKYYQGCDIVSEMEEYAIELAKELLPKADYINVQPHSGNDANIAVITGILEPGDRILSPHLVFGGGHLSHGAPVTVVGKYFDVMQYVAEETGWYDYDKIADMALEHKPKLIIGGTSAYSRAVDFARLREIADKVGAFLLADVSHYFGLIVAGLYPDPLEHADVLTTTTHKTLLGPKGAVVACVNRREYKEKSFSFHIKRSIFPHFQGGPSINNILAKAVSFEQAKHPDFKKLMEKIIANARALTEALKKEGIRIFTDGTDTHQMLLDLRPLERVGRNVARALEQAAIICNKNGIPGDPYPPMVTSGIRLGTTIVSQRGLSPEDIKAMAPWIRQIIDATVTGKTKKKENYILNEEKISQVREKVLEMCKRFPLDL